MARLIAALNIVTVGLDQATACFVAMNEAVINAHLDVDVEIECKEGGIRFRGTVIADITTEIGAGVVTNTIRPAAGMHLFVAWLMIQLPSRARVTWHDGWPHVVCPPNDNRDHEDEPTPLVPDELVTA